MLLGPCTCKCVDHISRCMMCFYSMHTCNTQCMYYMYACTCTVYMCICVHGVRAIDIIYILFMSICAQHTVNQKCQRSIKVSKIGNA